MKLPNWVLPGSAVFLLGACAVLQSPTERTESLAIDAGFVTIKLPDRRLRGFLRTAPGSKAADKVSIYVESDGAPWRMPDEPPYDPTPLKQMVLRMAVTDTSASVAYLGRPCQYLPPQELAQCHPELWMRGRFSEDAVAAMDAAVTRIKTNAGASGVNLIGYSGGGAIAALVATRRSDVSCLVTIAAPLDTEAWTTTINVSPLSYSLNPADLAHKLSQVRQTHFRGRQDTLVPPTTSQRFLVQTPSAVVIDKERYDHECCWGEDWKTVRQESCLAR
jgi:pimeloyl-ACP methyl ester carboxylesterase